MIISYLLRFLFTKRELFRLMKLLWRKRVLEVDVEHCFETQGTLHVSAPHSFALSLTPCQTVLVHFTAQNNRGESITCTRYMKLDTSSQLPIDRAKVGRNDVINIFGVDPVRNVIVKKILPYSALSASQRFLTRLDHVHLAQVNTLHTNDDMTENGCSEELKQYFASPKIFYSGDYLTVDTINPFKKKVMRCYFKIDSSISPCVIDASCSAYRSAKVRTYLPYSGQAFAPPVPETINEISNRITAMCFANEKLSPASPLVLLLNGPSGTGKRLTLHTIAIRSHRNLYTVDAYEIWNERAAQSEVKWKAAFEKAQQLSPCIMQITNCDVIGFDPSGFGSADDRVLSTVSSYIDNLHGVTVIFTCRSKQLPLVPARLRSLVLYTFSLSALSETQRESYCKLIFPRNIDSHKVAQQSSGFVVSELNYLLADAKYHAYLEKRTMLNWKDIEWAVDKRNSSFADAIGTPKIPTVKWSDVGGLEVTKSILKESIESNIRAGGKGLRRSGIILFGPPGCGKTLLAKAVATEYKIAFLSVKGPELLNKYVGQSEENLRNVFERARQASPCVIFFDELDSLAPNRGKNGDSGGVMDRIVSQLLSELDSLHSSPNVKVFVMAATNRADLLDPSLLTPGRFDKVVNVQPGTDLDSKTRVLEAVSRKSKLAHNVDLKEIASMCDNVMSGAELYSVVASATMQAVRETINRIESGELTEKEARVVINQRHLKEAVKYCEKQRKTVGNSA